MRIQCVSVHRCKREKINKKQMRKKKIQKRNIYVHTYMEAVKVKRDALKLIIKNEY